MEKHSYIYLLSLQEFYSNHVLIILRNTTCVISQTSQGSKTNKNCHFHFLLRFHVGCISVTVCPALKSHIKSLPAMHGDDDDRGDDSDDDDLNHDYDCQDKN